MRGVPGWNEEVKEGYLDIFVVGRWPFMVSPFGFPNDLRRIM